MGEFCHAQEALGVQMDQLQIGYVNTDPTPRQKDYCDTCASYTAKISALQTTLNRV